MATKIRIAPYVRDPRADAVVASVSRWTTCYKTIGRSLSDLAPHRLIDKSGSLFSIEIVLAATLFGTGIAWLFGSREHSIAIVLWIDALLGVTLLIGNLVRVAFAPKAVTVIASPPATVSHRAYRVSNYYGQCFDESRGAAKASSATTTNYTAIAELVAGEESAIPAPSAATTISSHLELDAIDPTRLCEGDVFLVEANQIIFADGMVLEGIAMVDESAVSGQSAPVLRSAGGVTAVMRNSRVVEGQLMIQVAPRRGHPLDWMGESPAVRRPQAEVVAPR